MTHKKSRAERLHHNVAIIYYLLAILLILTFLYSTGFFSEIEKSFTRS